MGKTRGKARYRRWNTGVPRDAQDSGRSEAMVSHTHRILTCHWLSPIILGWFPDKDGPVLSNGGDTHSLWGVWDIWGRQEGQENRTLPS